MNRKIMSTIIVVMVIVGLIGVIAYQTFGNDNTVIKVTYSTHPITRDSYWFISNTSTVTNIGIEAVFNSSKHIPTFETIGTPANGSKPEPPNSLNINDFYLASNGQPLTTYILTMGNTIVLNSTSGFAIMTPFDFTVRGNATSYQLAYNGTENVKVILENP
jgi:hypothetical protein